MKYTFAFAACLLAAPTLSAVEFNDAVAVNSGDKQIVVESPGYAAPSLADVDGDGIQDLLVGQFKSGKIGFYKGSKTKDGQLKFGAHEWLKAGGEVASVPGVW
ncbi:MAG: hypothetical protein ACYTDT_03715 [Planctomycetota bacterium]|jgi:hypothetical protein